MKPSAKKITDLEITQAAHESIMALKGGRLLRNFLNRYFCDRKGFICDLMLSKISTEIVRQKAIRSDRRDAVRFGDRLGFKTRSHKSVMRTREIQMREANRDALVFVQEQMQPAIRRAIQSELRKAGYLLHHSKGGSNYYSKWIDGFSRRDTVRVSNHAVPSTPARNHASMNGGFSWADCDFLDVSEFDTTDEAKAATLEFIAKEAA